MAKTQKHLPDKGQDTQEQKDFQRVCLAEFDRKLGELMLETDSTNVSPQLLVQTAAQHITEYGCWRSNGAATLVAATMLHGMSKHMSKYETPEANIDEHLSMEIHIHSEWLMDSDGKHETLALLRAITDHLCSWIGARIDPESGPTSGTLH